MDNIYNEIETLYKKKNKSLLATTLLLILFFIMILLPCIALATRHRIDNYETIKPILITIIVVGSVGFTISLCFFIVSFTIINKYMATTMIFDAVSKAEISEIVSIPKKEALTYYLEAFNHDRFIIPYNITFTSKIPFGTVFQGNLSYYVQAGKNSYYAPLINGLTYVMEINTIYEFFYAKCPKAKYCHAKKMRKEYKGENELLLVPKTTTSVSGINDIVEKLKQKFQDNFVFRCSNKHIMITYESENLFNYKERKPLIELQDKFDQFIKTVSDLREYFEELFL